MGDLEKGLDYFELEKVKTVDIKQKQNKSQIDDKQMLIRYFYLALGIQILMVYLICDLIQNNHGLQHITYESPLFYVFTYFIFFCFCLLLANSSMNSSQFLPFFLIYTIVYAFGISLFMKFYPQTGLYSLYFTFVVAFSLWIFSYFIKIEEQGYSIVASVLIFIFIISLIANKKNPFMTYIVATLLSAPFCFYSVNRIQNLNPEEKKEGFLVLSVKIYIYYIISFFSCLYKTLCGCCSGPSSNSSSGITYYDVSNHSTLYHGSVDNTVQCDCDCNCCNNCDLNCN